MAKVEAIKAQFTLKDKDKKVLASGEVEANYAFPETLEEAGEMFGEEVALSLLNAQLTVALQSNLRRWAASADEAGEVTTASEEELQANVDAWKPGTVNRSKKSKEDKVLDIIGDMDEDAYQAFLDDLEAKRKAKA